MQLVGRYEELQKEITARIELALHCDKGARGSLVALHASQDKIDLLCYPTSRSARRN